MGGSQVFLEPGEEMTAAEMVKCVVVASANDAAVALAEKVCGSEEAFVRKMNERAAEIGMTNTMFLNTNGLDDDVTGHVTSARDIAIMSRELITKYPQILEFSSIWMDSIRDGAFGLTNTNRLIRFYEGATGLKTGSTAKAGFCITATAKRGDMTLIAVIMGADTRDSRNAAAVSLLNYGFSNYSIYKHQYRDLADIRVLKGMEDSCSLVAEEFVTVIPKKKSANVKTSVSVQPNITAPFSIESEVGEVIYTLDGEELGRAKILTEHGVEKINFWRIFVRIFSKMLLK
jgi:D-alanyl-D-alanine carboxypeptidase (penicillin-binding protein 5/6)